MTRSSVYQLRLTSDEKDELARKAKVAGVSIARLIREATGLTERKEEPWPEPHEPKYVKVPEIEAAKDELARRAEAPPRSGLLPVALRPSQV